MPVKRRRNPFYVMLIPVGAAFVVTAFAYGVMAFQAVSSSSREATARAAHPLFLWLRTHGDAAMLWEVGVLAALTLAAIATDRFWDGPATGQTPRRDPRELAEVDR